MTSAFKSCGNLHFLESNIIITTEFKWYNLCQELLYFSGNVWLQQKTYIIWYFYKYRLLWHFGFKKNMLFNVMWVIKLDKNLKFWYIFSIVNFIIGLRIALTWSYTSRIVGVFLLIASLFIAYSCYRKSNILEHNAHDINIKQTTNNPAAIAQNIQVLQLIYSLI